jgi:hypothetical protein
VELSDRWNGVSELIVAKPSSTGGLPNTGAKNVERMASP